ncbi:selenium cofactor biosynthesis protein YqeC [Clostridium sp.]|uniref:selenium cofactor biosynthesis protein YqeC n=1 Tax=Clostridium sp. TaxID=1506 RepID=UPI0039949238
MNDVFKIKDKDVVSIVGSGGKTTLMNYLAKEFNKRKVLVSTTTKIRIPSQGFYDFIAFNKEEADAIKNINNKGIYVLGSKIKDNKLESFDLEYMKSITDNFDIVFLEADGSKEKYIKGWNEIEPVILDNTTITIGIINLEILGKLVNENNVHRVEQFMDLTGAKLNDVIEKEHLIAVIRGEKGLFKNSKGRRILLINGVKDNKTRKIANEITETILKKHNKIDEVIIGNKEWKC